MAESSVQADDAVREQPIPSSFEQLPFPSTFSFAPPNRHDDDGGMASPPSLSPPLSLTLSLSQSLSLTLILSLRPSLGLTVTLSLSLSVL